MRKVRFRYCWVMLLAVLASSSAQARQYTIHVLDTPVGNHYAGASGINDHGQIAGYYALNVSGNNFPQACLWDDTDVRDPGFTLISSRAAEINNRGEVVGRNLLWRDGEVTTLPTLLASPYGNNYFTDISNQGTVIGLSAADTLGRTHASYWDSAGIHDLGTLAGDESSVAYGINDDGQVVGTSERGSYSTSSVRSFMWDNGTMTDIGTLQGYNQSQALDINGSGYVVGSVFNEAYRYSGVYDRAFIWHDGIMTDLLNLGDTSSRAIKITDSGLVLGYTYTSTGDYRAFVWDNGTVNWLDGFGRDYNVRDINGNGWVVGQALGSDGSYQAVVWEPVPEPTPLLAVLAGLSGLVLRRKR